MSSGLGHRIQYKRYVTVLFVNIARQVKFR